MCYCPTAAWSYCCSGRNTGLFPRRLIPLQHAASTNEVRVISGQEHNESDGVWHFVTRTHQSNPDGSLTTRHSRGHRKGLSGERLWSDVTRALPRDLWLPTRLNWWIGAVFAIGAALFASGALLSLLPQLAVRFSMTPDQVSRIFFAGSIPFTIAAWLQLMQSANAGSLSTAGEAGARRHKLFGWYPSDAGWLSCALQFAGTLLFNINTFNAMAPDLDWRQQDLYIWVPNILGSILFLLSGYLAFAETCHRHWAWMPHLLSWRITFVNLLGCIFFMMSALFGFVISHPAGFDAQGLSVLFTLLGAVGFLIGAILMLPEAASRET